MPLKEQRPICAKCKHFEHHATDIVLGLRKCMHKQAGQLNIVDGKTHFVMAASMRGGMCGPYGRYYEPIEPTLTRKELLASWVVTFVFCLWHRMLYRFDLQLEEVRNSLLADKAND